MREEGVKGEGMRLMAGEGEGRAGVGGTKVRGSQGGGLGRKVWPGCLRILLGGRPRPMTLPVIMQAARSDAQSVREGGGATEARGGEEGW